MRGKSTFLSFLLVALFALVANTKLSAQTSDSGLLGRIAYIGADLNVYSIDFTKNAQIKLTDDATLTQNNVRYYRWPTWSTDGRLAYFLTSINNNASGVTAFVSKNGESAGEQVYSGDNELFQYAYWSPQNCAEGTRCRDLSILLSRQQDGKTGLFIELVRNTEQGTSNRLIGQSESPFYYSWSPDGTRMFWQQKAGTLDIYNVNNNTIIKTLSQTPGTFQAPAWSPVDDRLLFGVLNADSISTDMVIAANGEVKTIARSLQGSIDFSWSPNGNYVAYTHQGSPLYIVDAVTGEQVAQSTISGILAFFWSPNSQYIAYITRTNTQTLFNVISDPSPIISSNQEIPTVTWSVLKLDTGSTHRYGTFRPTEEMWYLLLFFNQFSQSHRVWSPDSTHLIYSQIVANNQPVISLLDTSQPDSVPFAIATGLIGVWSFQ